jgi:hypothetical protein
MDEFTKEKNDKAKNQFYSRVKNIIEAKYSTQEIKVIKSDLLLLGFNDLLEYISIVYFDYNVLIKALENTDVPKLEGIKYKKESLNEHLKPLDFNLQNSEMFQEVNALITQIYEKYMLDTFLIDTPIDILERSSRETEYYLKLILGEDGEKHLSEFKKGSFFNDEIDLRKKKCSLTKISEIKLKSLERELKTKDFITNDSDFTNAILNFPNNRVKFEWKKSQTRLFFLLHKLFDRSTLNNYKTTIPEIAKKVEDKCSNSTLKQLGNNFRKVSEQFDNKILIGYDDIISVIGSLGDPNKTP